MAIKYLDSKRIRGSSTGVGANVTHSQTSQNTQEALGHTNHLKAAQRIQAGHALIGKTVTSCSFYLAPVGSPTSDNVICELLESDGTFKATIGTVAGNSISSGAVVFTGGAGGTVVADDMLALRMAVPNNDNRFNIYHHSSSQEANSHWVDYQSGSWSNQTSKDLYFTATYASTVDEKATLIEDLQNLTSNDFGNVYSSSQKARGVKVNSADSKLAGKTVDSVTFYVKKGGSPTGTAYGKIYNGTTLVETNTSGTNLDVSTLTGTESAHTFEFGGTTTLDNGYSVVYEYSGGDGSNYTQFSIQSTDVYDGTNTVLRKYHGGSWSDSTGEDAKFKLNGGLVTKLPENTLFEETDTRGYYWLQDNEWKASSWMFAGQTTPIWGTKAYWWQNGTTDKITESAMPVTTNAVAKANSTVSTGGENTNFPTFTKLYSLGGNTINNIQEYTMGTTTASTDKADLRYAVGRCRAKAYDGTYGYQMGGFANPSTAYREIQSYTIGTTTTAIDKADLNRDTCNQAGGVYGKTYAYSVEGFSGSSNFVDIQEYAMGTTTTAVDKADGVAKRDISSIQNTTDIWTGDGTSNGITQYTMNTGTNATNHGNMSTHIQSYGSANSKTYGYWAEASGIYEYQMGSGTTITDKGDMTNGGSCPASGQGSP